MLLVSKKIRLFGKTYTLSWVHVMLFVILAIASYLRFANFPLKYGFDFDPTRDALIIAEGAKHLHFPLIGPKSGIGPFAFGPWYYYELILFKLVFPNPFSPWIFIGMTSVLTVGVMYLIGKELEGEVFGLLLALLTAFSPEEIGPTDGLSNPNLIPLHAAATVLLFIYYLKNQKRRWWVWLIWGLVFGIGVNHHYQMVLLAPLPIFAFLYKRNKLAIRDSLIFFGGVVVSFIPLFLYNFQNHWKTVTGFLYFVTTSRHATYIPNRWLFYVRDFWMYFLSMLAGTPQVYTLMLLLLTLGIIIYCGIKRKLSSVYLFLIGAFLIDFVFLRYFAVRKELYYFLFLHPFLFIFFGFALWQLTKVRMGWVLSGIILVTMLPTVMQQDTIRSATNQYNLRYFNEARMLEQAFPGKQIAIFGCNKTDINYLNYPQGVAFFLENDNRLADTGIPIALPTMECTKEMLSNSNISYKAIPGSSGVQLLSPSLSALQILYWQPISPMYVYTQTFEQ